MAGDFNKPALTDNYTAFAQAVRDLCADIAKGLDPALSLGTSNYPTNTVRWNSANGYWEKYSGSSWGPLASTYNINAATSSKWQTARTVSWSGDMTGTAAVSVDGSAAITLAATLATVNSSIGTYGSTTSIPVITVNGKGLVTSVSTSTIGSLAIQDAASVSITGGSISGTSLTLVQSTTAAPTAEGRMEWDTDDDLLMIGTGSATKVFAPLTPSSAVTATNHVMSTGSIWNGTSIGVSYGGTGATDAATARTNLGIGSIGTQASNSVSITGGSISGTSLTLVQSTTAAPTAEGRMEWDTDDDILVIGNGSGSKVFAPLAPTNTVTMTSHVMSTGCTWLGNAIPITGGGTGGTSATAALTNLLPAGAVSGYVLKTGGSGSYYWAAESGAGTNFGTTINSTRNTFTPTNGQTLITGLSTYVIGANQLRIYVNGSRLLPSEYTETSTTSATVSTAFDGTEEVLVEIDGYTSYNPTAAVVSFSPSGNIASTTVQDAIAELDAEKQPLDATLTALAGLTTGADKLPYFTGTDVATTTTLTSFVRTLLDDIDAATARTTLGAATSGAATSSGLTISTARLLGRTTAATGALEEISVGTGITLSSGVLSTITVPTSTTATTLVASDSGKCVKITAGMTIPASVFSADNIVSIYNDSASSLTITQGASLTLRQAGTSNTGNRTLASRGLITIWFISATEAVVSGSGLS